MFVRRNVVNFCLGSASEIKFKGDFSWVVFDFLDTLGWDVDSDLIYTFLPMEFADFNEGYKPKDCH